MTSRKGALEDLEAELAADQARPRILLVDDDERNLIALVTVLEDLGEVVTASSGEAALRELLHGDFAVILLDVFMPGMDGYEAAGLIRGRRQSARIPIIFLSAVNKEEEHLMRGYELGAVDYVFKPVDARVLQSKVAVFVDLYAMKQDILRRADAEQRLMSAAIAAREEKSAIEDELERVRRRQAAIVSSMPFLLFTVDKDSGEPKFLEANTRELTGFAAAELSADGFWLDRIHPDDRAAVEGCFANRREQQACDVEYRWQNAQGDYRHFFDQAAHAESHGGELVGTILDVSERRNLESQLIQAQKMDAIGQLTGGIAHDFNNLLAAVLGGLRLIRKRAKIAPEDEKIVEMTEYAAHQGVELIGRMLSFSRKQQLQPSSVSLDKLEASVSQLLSHSLGGLVEVIWRSDPNAPPVFADPAQLELAVMNLVINARDAMEDGGVITVECDVASAEESEGLALEPGQYIRIAIGDEGCGIPPEKIAQVTEPFYTTKEVGKGTGLGLSMAYGFSRQSGGDLKVRSELGKGTTVEIWLPAHETDGDEAEDSGGDSSAKTTTGSLDVLLVDDDVLVRRATAEMLDELGHRVLEFGSARETLDALAEKGSHFDVIVTDYAMPRMSGLDMIQQIYESYPDCPTLLITGYADTRELARKSKGIPVLGKPFSIHDLDRLLGQLTAG